MFAFLEKIIRKTKLKVREKFSSPSAFYRQNGSKKFFSFLGRVKGQVAIVLILMTALAIILYAVTLNLGKVSELKTLTTIAATTSAAQMASYWASYAEQLFQVRLGGESETDDLTICGLGPIVQIFISIFLIVIAIIIIVASWGSGTLLALAIIGLVLALGALALQVMVLDPGLTSMWNKMMRNLDAVDQYLERGISSAMQTAVNDVEQLDDLHDMNLNGLFGLDTSGVAKDKVSRFGFYYTKRLQKIETFGDPAVQVFRDALEVFMRFFWDAPNCIIQPTNPCCGITPPSECNPCCQSPTDPRTGLPLRPTCCDGLDPDFPACGTSVNCLSSSAYGVAYPPTYDPWYETYWQDGKAFRSRLGVDDENRYFHTNPFRDNTVPQVLETETNLDGDGVTRPIFRIDDSKGDMVFSTFWKFSDWGVDLSELTLDANDMYKRYECHMCSANHPGCGDVSGLLSEAGSYASLPGTSGGLSPQLVLPTLPGAFNGGDCVFDPNDPRDSTSIIRPDMVKTIESLIVFPEANYATECGQATGRWKRGADRYCTTIWPYSLGCDKAGGYVCIDPDTGATIPCNNPCAPANAAMWPDDTFDDFIYNSKPFVIWGQKFVDANINALARTFKSWYPDIIPWLAPQVTGTDPARDPFLNPSEDGKIIQWRSLIYGWWSQVNNWLVTNFLTQNCNEALCLPNPRTGILPSQIGAPTPAGLCKGLKQAEENFTYKDGDGVQAVVNCLTYNVDNIPKFSACANSCTETNCTDLPRSLLIYNSLDPFDTNEFVAPKDSDVIAFNDCVLFGVCFGLPSGPSPWPGINYTGDASQDLILASGSCVDPLLGVGPDGKSFADWQPKLLLSAQEAQNQLAKLVKRRDFLAARVLEMQNLEAFLNNAVFQFDTIIAAADALINARVAAEAFKTVPSLASFAIYGWQSQPPPLGNMGLWHIVRVDARTPGRCNGSCGRNGNVEPDLPTVKTYTTGFLGWKRCFSMGDAFDKHSGCDDSSEYDDTDQCFLGGTVKAQVTRWDQDKSQMSFPNTFNFWRFLSHNPSALGGVPGVNDLDIICTPFAGAGGAFMLNHAPSDEDDGGNPNGNYHQCWIRVNALLQHGITSQACAEYFYHDETPHGFNLKFVPCSGTF